MRGTVIAILFFVSFMGKSQNVHYHLNLQGGGFGGYGSIGVTKTRQIKKYFKTSFRIGLSTYNIYDYTNEVNPSFIAPLSQYLMFGHKHHLEVGGSYITTSLVKNLGGEKVRTLQSSLGLGIRYKYFNPNKKFSFATGYSPIYQNHDAWRAWWVIEFGWKMLYKK